MPTLASPGFPPSGPSISCSLFRSVADSVAFLNNVSIGDSFLLAAASVAAASGGTELPLPACRPDNRSSRRFFFLDLSSAGASAN